MGCWKKMQGIPSPVAEGLRSSHGGQRGRRVPLPAEEELRDVISFDEYLITKPGTSFLLRVSGDSMIDEGIHQGDLVVIEKGREPEIGRHRGSPRVDGEWTLKFFRNKGKDVFLEAANPKYPPIRARSELRVGRGRARSCRNTRTDGSAAGQDRTHHKKA